MLDSSVALMMGCASGIGAVTARRYVQEGAKAVIADRDADAGSRLVAALRQEGADVHFVEADLTLESDVTRVVETTLGLFGRIDILHNNTGGSLCRAKIGDVSLQDWEATFARNVTSTFLACRSVLPVMVRQRHGVIVNTGSQMGLVAGPQQGPYNAAKAAVIMLTKNIAIDYAPYGIRANCVCPGATESESLTRDFVRTPGEREQLESWIARHPLGRPATPYEVAEASLFLASPRSSFVTGHALVVDGGFTAL